MFYWVPQIIWLVLVPDLPRLIRLFFFSQVLVPNFHSALWIQVQCEKMERVWVPQTHNSLIKPQEVVGSLLRLRPS